MFREHFLIKEPTSGERCWRESRERSVDGKGRGIKPVTRGHLRWCFVWESVAMKRHGGYDECVKVTWGLCWVVHVAHWGWVVPCIVSQAGTLSSRFCGKLLFCQGYWAWWNNCSFGLSCQLRCVQNLQLNARKRK